MGRGWIFVYVAGVALGLALSAGLGLVRSTSSEPDIDHYRRVRDFVSESFVRDVSRDEMLDHALHGLAEGLDDYSRYYDAGETAELERETAGRFTGLGVVFKRPIHEGRILFPLQGSPAERAGLAVGDRIVSIDDRPLAGMSDEAVRDLLEGGEQPGLRFLVVALNGTSRSITVGRESVVDPTVRHERMLDEQLEVGYVAITSFSRETADEFDRAFDRLSAAGAKALVLDLRGNPGGVLSAAIDIARRFIVEGVIASTEGRERAIVHRAEAARAWHRGFPLVVLVDEHSASASEVLAGALQEHRAAVIVGAPTYGKGTVQTIRHFPEVEAVAKVTTSFYYTPAHRNLERSFERNRDFGIAPDVRIEIPPSEKVRIQEFLIGHSPPPEALPALKAWDAAESAVLVESPPADAQLEAALALFRGQRPGSRALPEKP